MNYYTADDIPDDIIQHWQDYFYGDDAIEEPLIQFNPVHNLDYEERRIEEENTVSVFVYAFSEESEPIDRGDTCKEQLVVSIVVEGPITDIVTKKLCCKFCKQLRYSLRETEFSAGITDSDTSYRWLSDEVEALYDTEALAANRFLCGIKVTYHAFS